MLILNADDFGRTRLATDRILDCHRQGTVTSTSGMVFMEDSERAAELAKETEIDVGLHLNLDERLTGRAVRVGLRERHERLLVCLSRSCYSRLLFHPLLAADFRYVWQSQYEEFHRIFGVAPSHVDGHHHLHLSTNMLVQRLIPRGTKVRRNFSFAPREKNFANRTYRGLVDRWIGSRHPTPDYLFSLPDCLRHGRLEHVISLAEIAVVEIESHPEVTEDYKWLMGEFGRNAFSGRRLATYREMAGGLTSLKCSGERCFKLQGFC